MTMQRHYARVLIFVSRRDSVRDHTQSRVSYQMRHEYSGSTFVAHDNQNNVKLGWVRDINQNAQHFFASTHIFIRSFHLWKIY